MAGNKLREVLNERGAAMAMLLVVIAIAAILAFTLAGGSIFHLTVATKEANGSDARNLAESAIAQCISNVMADTTGNYGKSNETIVVIRNQDPTGTGGLITSFLADVPAAMVTFDKTSAKSNSLPYSYNNLTGTTASDQGWYGKVPAFSMQIIAAGKNCGTTKYLEAILKIPPFPYCIATSGKFISSGDLYVASVGTGSSSSDRADAVDSKKNALPGHVLSNNTSDDSVTLNGKGEITGDVQTSGKVYIAPSSTVVIDGEVRNKYDPITLPAIDLANYDPKDKAGVKNLATLLNKPTLQGFNRVDGTLNIVGDLTLDGALLYVTGSLIVTGGVSGKGALVVQGSATIGSGVSIASDSLVALMCKGNVTITGDSAASKKSDTSFQGLVYGAGNFTAKDISICGYFINAGGENSQISLSNVSFVQVPEYSAISVSTLQSSGVSNFSFYDSQIDDDLGEEYQIRLGELKTQLGDEKFNEMRNFFKEYGPKFSIKENGSKYDYYVDGEIKAQSVEIDSIGTKIRDFFENEFDPYIISKYGDQFFAEKYVVPIAPYSITFASNWGTFLTEHPRCLESLATKESDPTGPGQTVPVFSFDLNEFLRAADRMKVVLWREIDSPQK